MAKYPIELITLIAFLRKLPGVGTKTAERFAFQFLSWPEEDLKKVSILMNNLKENIQYCSECGCIKTANASCNFCDNPQRQTNMLCIISSPKDAYAIEETHAYKGYYHVLNNLLSPIEGKSIEERDLVKLKQRIDRRKITEVVIALDSTLEGDATSLYLKDQLSIPHLTISRLALGIPMGSSLEYIDGGTLSRAFIGRNSF